MPVHEQIPSTEIRAARERLEGSAVRTPLVRLEVDGPAEIHLKLENLQPIGSFKLRGAANAIALASDEELARGVWTASAGNMAQGVAWCARQRAVPCTVVVPKTAPVAKLEAIDRLGARTITVPFDEWFEVFRTHEHEGLDGLFVHAFSDRNVMAGNGTIALELLEDLPELDAVVVPYGGGGLACGIASALRELAPSVRIYACEADVAAPLAASLAAGRPVVVDHTPSFVDGIGGPFVFDEMFELTRRLVDRSLVVSLEDVAAALRLLVERNHVVAEGAGAVPVAAALAGQAGAGNVACIVSGGNIDTAKLRTILEGGIP